jgi:hypothetical protein
MDTSNIILFSLVIACIAAAVSWFVLLLYRGRLEAREDDQIFIDKAEDSLAQEQRELIARIEKLNPVIHSLLVVWIALALASAGLWIWIGLKSF